MELVERMEPSRALTEAARASEPRLTNLGKATAYNMPRITMTMTNSIRVKPDCFFILTFFQNMESQLRCAAPFTMETG